MKVLARGSFLMKNIFRGLVPLLLLAACMGNNQRPPGEAEFFTLRTNSKEECLSKGHTAGSEKYIDCYTNLISKGLGIDTNNQSPQPVADVRIVLAENYCISLGFEKGSSELSTCKYNRMQDLEKQKQQDQLLAQKQNYDFWSAIRAAGQASTPNTIDTTCRKTMLGVDCTSSY